MATHAYHSSLEGYDERQILVDGCLECERRAKEVNVTMRYIDRPTFARAWQRAFDYFASRGDRSRLGAVSRAETALLETLWAVQIKFEHLGMKLTGDLPVFLRPTTSLDTLEALRKEGELLLQQWLATDDINQKQVLLSKASIITSEIERLENSATTD